MPTTSEITNEEKLLYKRLRELCQKYSNNPIFSVPNLEGIDKSWYMSNNSNAKEKKKEKKKTSDIQNEFNKAIIDSLNFSDEFKKDRTELKEMVEATGKSLALWSGKTAQEFLTNSNQYFSDTELIENARLIDYNNPPVFPNAKSQKTIAPYNTGFNRVYGGNLEKYISKLALIEALLLPDTVETYFKYPNINEEGILNSSETFFHKIELPIIKKMHEEGLIQKLNIHTQSSENGNQWKLEHEYNFNLPNGGIFPFETIDYHPRYKDDHSAKELETKKVSKIYEALTNTNVMHLNGTIGLIRSKTNPKKKRKESSQGNPNKKRKAASQKKM